MYTKGRDIDKSYEDGKDGDGLHIVPAKKVARVSVVGMSKPREPRRAVRNDSPSMSLLRIHVYLRWLHFFD